MRIISGQYRRRVLESPPDAETTRPIPDRVKESVFALLRGRFEGACVADIFAGTGSIGLEAISRGAAACIFVERDRRVHDLLRRNITTLGCEDEAKLVRADALGPETLTRITRFAEEHGGLDLLFMDPPYPLVWDKSSWSRIRRQFERLVPLLKDDAFAILRTPYPCVHGGRAKRTTERDVDTITGPDGEELELVFEEQVTEAPDDIDLVFDVAEGPETHVYRHSAVHLYMRADRVRPPDTEDDAEGGDAVG